MLLYLCSCDRLLQTLKHPERLRLGALTCSLGLAALLTAPLAQVNASAQSLEMMPLPASATAGAGTLRIDAGLQVVFEGFEDARLDRARYRFVVQLSKRTGIYLWPVSSASTPKLVIHTAKAGNAVQELGEDESYHLDVTPQGIKLNAPTPLGAMHGLQTLLQLVHSTPQGFVMDEVHIEDHPRFPWRGLMIDAGRHFIPADLIRLNLDLMEAAKLNVLHWHLSDDQGFRVESRRYPLLQQKGSDGQYYTQAEVHDIVAYARDRGIRVVPEFDMPGHATSWFVGYPELASGKGPYEISREWGVLDPAMDPTRESTYTFLNGFLAEMTALFPDAYFHVGGDECNGKEWNANPRIQQFMRAHDLKDTAALQAYFTGRVQKLVTRHGKITVGWDEVLQPGTPKDVVIQSWRGQDSLAQAAHAGNRGLLSWGYYLDLNEPAGQHYAVDPMAKSAAQLGPEEQARILGGEAAEWTEYLSPELLTTRIWPRAAVIAERLWSPQSTKDEASMYRRMATFNQDLAWYGLQPGFTERPVFQRLTVNGDRAALAVLAGVVEPPKEYAREELKHSNAYTPLNRMVDAVPAESLDAREFSLLATRIAAGNATQDEIEKASQWLTRWQSNDRELEPHLRESVLTEELIPVSKQLSQASAMGLAAIDALQKGSGMQNKDDDLKALKGMEAAQAVLLDQAIPSIELLVRAAKP